MTQAVPIARATPPNTPERIVLVPFGLLAYYLMIMISKARDAASNIREVPAAEPADMDFAVIEQMLRQTRKSCA